MELQRNIYYRAKKGMFNVNICRQGVNYCNEFKKIEDAIAYKAKVLSSLGDRIMKKGEPVFNIRDNVPNQQYEIEYVIKSVRKRRKFGYGVRSKEEAFALAEMARNKLIADYTYVEV